uniref:Uncharacterized protein n=1 Tax=Utricularia reniformis TaxID=192314 RepID=A0A1Y0AZN4_9LAMI|nr:hypothetical protein AEK19_MT0370 [Utricularia reniformis]ART30642.1 hypothetical protein AEK19_MT0370 [Utricularia reniformis]
MVLYTKGLRVYYQSAKPHSSVRKAVWSFTLSSPKAPTARAENKEYPTHSFGRKARTVVTAGKHETSRATSPLVLLTYPIPSSRKVSYPFTPYSDENQAF